MRLIDADAAYERAQADSRRGALEDWEFDMIVNLLDSAPTVDAAPVVRCRDCKFMLPDVLPYVGKTYAVGLKCDLRDDYSICEGDYCSRGARRGGGPDGR